MGHHLKKVVPAFVWCEMEHERFVNADVIAEYLCSSRRRVLAMARAGIIPGRAISGTKRRTWIFLVSEVAGHMAGAKGTNNLGSPSRGHAKENEA